MVVNFNVVVVTDFVATDYFIVATDYFIVAIAGFAVVVIDFIVVTVSDFIIMALILLRFIQFRQTFSFHLLSYGLKLNPMVHYFPHSKLKIIQDLPHLLWD